MSSVGPVASQAMSATVQAARTPAPAARKAPARGGDSVRISSKARSMASGGGSAVKAALSKAGERSMFSGGKPASVPSAATKPAWMDGGISVVG
jgi:hypothetical protein